VNANKRDQPYPNAITMTLAEQSVTNSLLLRVYSLYLWRLSAPTVAEYVLPFCIMQIIHNVYHCSVVVIRSVAL